MHPRLKTVENYQAVSSSRPNKLCLASGHKFRSNLCYRCSEVRKAFSDEYRGTGLNGCSVRRLVKLTVVLVNSDPSDAHKKTARLTLSPGTILSLRARRARMRSADLLE